MKTLAQLWQENGEKPFKAIHESRLGTTDYVCILNVGAPSSVPLPTAIGYDRDYNAKNFIADHATWSLYQEPKPRRLAWICKKQVMSRRTEDPLWLVGAVLFTLETHPVSEDYWTRAPWLDEPEQK